SLADEHVATAGAGQPVIALPAPDHVATRAAGKRVLPAAADHAVVTLVANRVRRDEDGRVADEDVVALLEEGLDAADQGELMPLLETDLCMQELVASNT